MEHDWAFNGIELQNDRTKPQIVCAKKRRYSLVSSVVSAQILVSIHNTFVDRVEWEWSIVKCNGHLINLVSDTIEIELHLAFAS